jgi:hypothetical protein
MKLHAVAVILYFLLFSNQSLFAFEEIPPIQAPEGNGAPVLTECLYGSRISVRSAGLACFMATIFLSAFMPPASII